jgi:hypothetical protein
MDETSRVGHNYDKWAGVQKREREPKLDVMSRIE